MIEIQNSKLKKINDIVSVVKIVSLLFLSIPFLRYFLYDFKSLKTNVMSYYNLASISLISLLFSFVYGLWVFSTKGKLGVKYKQYINAIDNYIFILIFFTVIVFTGSYTSDYKFLFLFIIITSTIQCGMNQGLIVAGVCSVLILTLDLVCMPNVQINEYFQNDLIMAGVFILTAWPLGFYVKTESEHIEELQSLVNKDGLTGVYNHRFFCDILKKIIKESENDNKSVSMIFIDIDYFKYYNDLYGHQKGDDILRDIGNILRDNVRTQDIVARYGGEEFAIILPDTKEDEATLIAEGIRKKIEKTNFEGEENQPNGRITVSIGVSVYPDKAKSDIELIKSSDDALYRAKFFDKNRVEIYTSILDDLKNDIEEEHIDLITSIKTLISVINAKDRYTYGHVERVVMYSRMLADKLDLNEEEKKNLIYGAYMHDIGKINISKDILNKRMGLTNEEWEILKQHPTEGVEIIKSVDSLQSISPVILYHHERYDGKGYPENLKGDDIPYNARILTVVDSFDAMTSERPYNKRKSYGEAIEELKRCSGTQFDPKIAEAFIEGIKESIG
ncbi:bifunctional diguanylate cyclase/phosphohydrolase [Clostridium intestinale]|uniref:Diguanylate cyclase n=1 Tax=Clostridium intestinale URNW TaxID=1294142 RepID=U2Q6Q2_9CLOT|nr:diguanylate cyclase [Clostridium intestinale]ERK31839.1 diguanylate cyclase [Clostridium intestinale URNW]